MAYFVQRATKHALRTRTDKYAQQLHVIVERYEHSDKKVGIRKTKQAQRQRNGALRKNLYSVIWQRKEKENDRERTTHLSQFYTTSEMFPLDVPKTIVQEIWITV